jgi:hypothetical protein
MSACQFQETCLSRRMIATTGGHRAILLTSKLSIAVVSRLLERLVSMISLDCMGCLRGTPGNMPRCLYRRLRPPAVYGMETPFEMHSGAPSRRHDWLLPLTEPGSGIILSAIGLGTVPGPQ